LTPHPGEMARLIGKDTAAVNADRVGIARLFAVGHRCHLVLKGARTVIASADGKVFINPTGNPGMASGGMGDVLAGIITALLGQGLSAEDAMKLGVYGTKGAMEIWFESEKMGLRVCAGADVNTQTWRDVEAPPVPNTYETFIDAVRRGETLEPSFRRAAELQHVLDLAFESDRLGTALPVEPPLPAAAVG
jgi:hypothetical protein